MRLEWDGKDRPNDRDRTAGLRALPPGRYTLAGYRISRLSDRGEAWFISAILPKKGGRQFQVRPGQVTRLGIKPEISISCRGQAAPDGRFAVRVVIGGENHSGLSIYREGKRIAMGFKIETTAGEELDSGSMDYG